MRATPPNKVLNVGWLKLFRHRYAIASLRQPLDQIDAEIAIPRDRSRKSAIPHDTSAFKLKTPIERDFKKLRS